MTEGIPAHRLAAAVPQAIALVAGVDAAKDDRGASLEGAMTAALGGHPDPEALVLALSNMCHALAVTLARQTGTTVADLLASMGQVGPGHAAGG
jgi:hypothetical protein